MKVDERGILIVSVLVAGLCSIVYELLIGTCASYFLGDTVKQFSITIGLFMASMGIGSYLSRAFDNNLLFVFIAVEIVLGAIGGLSVPLLYTAFAYSDVFYPTVLGLIVVIGTLTGLELPLLTRILQRHYVLKANLANVLALDYLGALLATLAFPFLLLPFLGIFKSSLAFGLINMGVGLLNLWYFADRFDWPRRRALQAACAVVVVVLGLTLVLAKGLLAGWSEAIYIDRVVYRERTPYQLIVLTKYKDDLRLYLDGGLQFSTADEYRYHEPLIHLPMAQIEGPVRVLILGGGDGMAARELLKYERVRAITIVDLDPAIFRLGRENPQLVAANDNALADPRVQTISADAFVYVRDDPRHYQLIVADLPDPKNAGLARLYSREFYRMVQAHLTAGGVFVTQATSPLYAREAFWTVARTLEAAGFDHVLPYHSYVPSFGAWGFVAAAMQPLNERQIAPGIKTRFLADYGMAGLTRFPNDMASQNLQAVSTLDRPRVLYRYMDGWQRWR